MPRGQLGGRPRGHRSAECGPRGAARLASVTARPTLECRSFEARRVAASCAGPFIGTSYTEVASGLGPHPLHTAKELRSGRGLADVRAAVCPLAACGQRAGGFDGAPRSPQRRQQQSQRGLILRRAVALSGRQPLGEPGDECGPGGTQGAARRPIFRREETLQARAPLSACRNGTAQSCAAPHCSTPARPNWHPSDRLPTRPPSGIAPRVPHVPLYHHDCEIASWPLRTPRGPPPAPPSPPRHGVRLHSSLAPFMRRSVSRRRRCCCLEAVRPLPLPVVSGFPTRAAASRTPPGATGATPPM